MNQIQVTARLQIHPGKLEAFKETAAAALQIVREKDTGTTQYDWFLNSDQTVCIARETYADSQAVLMHMANLGGQLQELASTCDADFEFCGTLSPELMAAVKNLPHKVYQPFQGL